MRTLVIQVQIAKGHLDHTKINFNSSQFLQDVTIRSCRDWCYRMGYDHKLVTTIDDRLLRLEECQSIAGMRYAVEKYLHLNDARYDRILLLDADVYVSNNCPQLPLCTGLGAGHVSRWRIEKWHREHINNPRYILVNAGFLLFDRDTALRFYFYIIKLLNDPSSAFYTPWYHDECLLADFMSEFNDITYTYVGDEWNNYELDDYQNPYKSYMYHLAGPNKEEKYNNLRNKGLI